jgi:hypothetical protein
MRLRVLSLCIVVALTSLLHAEPNAADLVASALHPNLGAAVSVANLEIPIGHMTFSISQGSSAPVMAGERQIGVFYSGKGTFTYTTAEKLEFPSTRYNARSAKIDVTASADKIVIRDAFQSVLLWSTSPKTSTGSAPADEAAFKKLRETFDDNRDAPASAHRYALHVLSSPSDGWTRAEIFGDRLYTYEFDPTYEQAETLAALRTVDTDERRFKRWLFPLVLSEQPVGRAFGAAPAPRMSLTHVDVDLTASDKSDARLVVTETIVPQQAAQSAFRFDLYDEKYVEVGRDLRKYNVKSIVDERGRNVSFDHRLDSLIVSLPEPAPAGKPFKLKFEIEGDFLYHPRGDSYWELGVEPWFPLPELNEQAFTLHALVRVKGSFIPFAPGKTIRRAVEGEYNVVETQIDDPVQFVAILAGKYEYAEETRNGITVRVASYGGKNELAFKRLIGIAFDVINYYPMFLGPFPFPELNIIEKNAYGYGQAPAATMFITKEVFTPQKEGTRMVGGINARFAHEIAHQYWGHVVKMPSLEEQWLTEAFAEYSAALVLRAAKGDAAYDRMVSNWWLEAKEWQDIAPIPLANRLRNYIDPFDQWMSRKHLIYDKGALLLAALHKELGDQLFLSFLKSYQKSFRWKYGTTRDVVGMLGFITKKDYKPFFDQYYWGIGLPDVKH